MGVKTGCEHKNRTLDTFRGEMSGCRSATFTLWVRVVMFEVWVLIMSVKTGCEHKNRTLDTSRGEMSGCRWKSYCFSFYNRVLGVHTSLLTIWIRFPPLSKSRPTLSGARKYQYRRYGLRGDRPRLHDRTPVDPAHPVPARCPRPTGTAG